jgi:hypothetical protein
MHLRPNGVVQNPEAFTSVTEVTNDFTLSSGGRLILKNFGQVRKK